MAKLDKYVQDHFGSDFLIWDDFYSYRNYELEMFPTIHQDDMFWSTANHDCAGFNFWFLLNHHQYKTSFDIYEVDKNPRLYEGINMNEIGSISKETWFPRISQPAYNAQRTNVPLSIGEALIVKQPEVHQTDHDNISKGQWRLGIGFKVVRRGTIKYDLKKGLGGDPNYLHIRADPWLPSLDIGSTLWSPFNDTILREYWQQLDARNKAVSYFNSMF